MRTHTRFVFAVSLIISCAAAAIAQDGAAAPVAPIPKKTESAPDRLPPLASAITKANGVLGRSDTKAPAAQPAPNADELNAAILGEFITNARVVQSTPNNDGSVRLAAEIIVSRNVQASRQEGENLIAARRQAVKDAEQAATQRLKGIEQWKRRRVLVHGRQQYRYCHKGCQLRFRPMSEEAWTSARDRIVEQGRDQISAARAALSDTSKQVSDQRNAAVKRAKTVAINVTIPANHPLIAKLQPGKQVELKLRVNEYDIAMDTGDIEAPRRRVTAIHASLADADTRRASR